MKNLISLQKEYQELHNDLGISYTDFVTEFTTKFYEEHNLPALHLWESFYKGDASINDLVDLKNTLNGMYGDDAPAVYFEMNENDNWEDDGEEEYFTDIFDFLDSKFCEQLEAKLIEYKDDKRDEIFDILKDLAVNRDSNNPNFTKYYYTLCSLDQYIENANLDENDDYYESDLDTTIANYIDYDSTLSKYF